MQVAELEVEGASLVLSLHGRGFCADCLKRGRHYIAEDYVARKLTWEAAWPGTYQTARAAQYGKHFLCIACLEKRLDRKLTRDDLDMRRMKNVARDSGRFHVTAKLRRLLRRPGHNRR
jgi:hypothetical protein